MRPSLVFTILLGVIMIIAMPVYAALSDYTFTQTGAQYTELPSPTVIHSTAVDDAMSPAIDIGFTFVYDDMPYTQFKSNSNGFITLDLASTASLTNALATRLLILGGLWDDLKSDDTNAGVSYQLMGAAPNRALYVQYKNMKWYYNASPVNLINFQIVLYETTNVINFVYGTMGATPGTTASASIGISGAAAGNYISVTPATPTATASSTAEFTAINGTHVPFIIGNMYVFSPPVPVPNDLQALTIVGDTAPTAGSPETYNVSIRNRGTDPQTTYSVKLMSGATELASVAGPAIQPGEILQVPVSYTFTVTGPTTIFGKVVLAGDANPANDATAPITVNVQAANVVPVTIGAGDQVARMPIDFYWKNSLYECIYLASEINLGGLLTGVAFYNNFTSTELAAGKPTKIWIGETTATDLSAGWIPSTQLTQVYDGLVSYPVGQNIIIVTFSTPYVYGGGNLVMMVNRPMDTEYFDSTDNFACQTIGTARSRKLQSDTVTYDPAAPATATPTGQFPKTTLFFVVSGMGAIQGTVTVGGNPLAGAVVSVVGTPLTQTTGPNGTYSFPYVPMGPQQVSCSIVGYAPQTANVTVIENQTVTQDFVMVALPEVNVFGTVTGSDAPTVGLADAMVNLTGILDYSGTTNASGVFTITGVLTNNTYSYSISKQGYQNATGTITVGTIAYDMGTIILNEISNPPTHVSAELNPTHTTSTVTWNAPGSTGPGNFFDFEFDDGGWVPSSSWTDPLGDWEWGNDYNMANYTDIDTYVDEPPTAAYSGTGMWGTGFESGYSNCGGWSYLKKTFNFTGITDPVLNMWHYMNGYNTWDYGLILVNGTTVWGTAASAEFMPWQNLNVALTAFAGQSDVEISFEWYATSVVSYAGWYLDDIYVGTATGVPTRSQVFDVESNHHFNPVNPTIDRSLLGYKVWRLLSGQEANETLWTSLTANVTVDTFYVDNGWATLADGNYKWAVKAVYTNNVMSVPMFSNMIYKTLEIDVTGLVVGSDAPTVGLADATVSLMGTVDFSAVTNASGQFTIPFVYANQIYNYTVSKVGYQNATGTITLTDADYNMGTITLNEIALPATTVQAVEAAPNVNVTWMQPGTGGGDWIQWDSNLNNDSIGMTAGGTFDVASRWPAADLTDYIGQSLYAVKFWPGSVGTYRVRVWTGGSATAPDQMVVDEAYPGYTVDEFNTYVLPTPIPIQPGQELWFGYNVTHASGAYPAGCDAGPAHDGLGNMIYTSGAWTTLYTLATSLNYDWNIAGYVGYSAPTARGLAPMTQISFSEVRESKKILAEKSTGSTLKITPNLRNDRMLEGYKVWRLLQGQETSENLWTLLTTNTITATAYQDMGWNAVPDGTYKWAVKAVYTGNVLAMPAFSNAIQKLTQIGTIAGIVRQTNNSPIAGATITAGTYTATSNGTGAYSLQVPAGTYTVTCTADNYMPGTQDGVVVITGVTTQVNFILEASTLATDGFETYTDFAIDFAPWINVDVDQSGTYGFNGFDFPGEYQAMAFMIFNPLTTVPASTDDIGTAHGGDKMAHCWAATTPPNNDWMISQMYPVGDGAYTGFWARSLTADYGLERFKVGVSSGGTAPADFTIISPGAYVQAPIDWTYYQYNIPVSFIPGDVRIGINCVSNDAFIFMVDDFVITINTANEDPVPAVTATLLNGNYPNPFNPETSISYSVKGNLPVVVEVYNTKGQRVRTLVNETKATGNYNVKWDGTDDNNHRVTSGVYFYKMKAGTYTSSRKMILMK